MDITWEKKG